VAAPAKPPMAATMQQFVAPKVVPPMPSAVVAKAEAQQAKNTRAQGPDSAAGVDELLSGVSEAVKREDMQSGTHRKVMSTLIGVAPPPQPVIGKPPPVTVPTGVIVNDAPSTSARGTAGIADLIGTAVPSTVISSALASKPQEEPSQAVEPRKQAATSDPPLVDSRLTALSEEVRRYRRLTILFGSISVLLLTLLCWLVIGGLGSSNTEPLQTTPQPVAVHRSPVAAPPPAAPVPALSNPALPNPSASATASAVATANSQSTTSAPKAARAPQKKQAKKFVPDGI